MKAGWKEATLGEVCTLQRGFDLPVQDRIGGDVPLISSSGSIGFVSEARVPGPGVATGRSGSIGAVFFCETAFWPLNTALYVRDFHGNDARFIWYLLQFFDLSRFASGTGVPTLNRNDVHGERVAVPNSVEEQHKIVAVLDEAFEGLARARAHAEANLRDARELFQRSLDLAFVELSEAAPIKTIGQIADIRGGKRLPQGGELKAEDTGFPYISIKDFTDDGGVDPKTVRFLDADTQEQIKRYIIRSDDLYISIAGTIGKTGIVPPELDGANLTENAARLVFESGVANEYVYLFSRTTDFQDQAGLNTRTAAQPKLALSRLSTITLPLPEQQVQADLICRMTAIREISVTLSATYSDKINRIEALRQSLLQKAFAGELT